MHGIAAKPGKRWLGLGDFLGTHGGGSGTVALTGILDEVLFRYFFLYRPVLGLEFSYKRQSSG